MLPEKVAVQAGGFVPVAGAPRAVEGKLPIRPELLLWLRLFTPPPTTWLPVAQVAVTGEEAPVTVTPAEIDQGFTEAAAEARVTGSGQQMAPIDVLEGDDLARMLDLAQQYRPLFTLLAFTGLRIGEALGLSWRDVDFEQGLLRVHRQLTRYREHGPLKTEAGRREVLLAPPVVRLLREVWLTSMCKGDDDPVFVNRVGRSLDYRHVGTAFRSAVDRAGVRVAGRLSLHSLRHGYASMLIGSGVDVVFVSRQLGHAKPDVTLRVYAHLFARREHAERARAAISSTYAEVAAASRG